jgi:hypothetical protein
MLHWHSCNRWAAPPRGAPWASTRLPCTITQTCSSCVSPASCAPVRRSAARWLLATACVGSAVGWSRVIGWPVGQAGQRSSYIQSLQALCYCGYHNSGLKRITIGCCLAANSCVPRDSFGHRPMPAYLQQNDSAPPTGTFGFFLECFPCSSHRPSVIGKPEVVEGPVVSSSSRSSRKGSGLTPNAVFALATPKSPIGQCTASHSAETDALACAVFEVLQLGLGLGLGLGSLSVSPALGFVVRPTAMLTRALQYSCSFLQWLDLPQDVLRLYGLLVFPCRHLVGLRAEQLHKLCAQHNAWRLATNLAQEKQELYRHACIAGGSHPTVMQRVLGQKAGRGEG